VTPWQGLALGASLLCGCSRGSYVPEDGLGPSTPEQPLPENTEFRTLPEFEGPCEKRTSIDVNLGNEPEEFVRAAHCQITGSEPAADVVTSFSEALRTHEWVRRIDVVRSLCSVAQRECALVYSEPWQDQVLLTAPCVRKGTRDIGAALMFFSECPDGVNCGMDWANTHVEGMQAPHQLYAFGAASEGYYHPDNAGFWKRELLDARWAGLQFLLLNTYGPDLGRLAALNDALADIGGGMQIALLDDTWTWGRVQQPPWDAVPDLNDSEAAAQLIYDAKWKRFFGAVAPENWYLVSGRPLIYFYNAGTLKPLNRSAAVVARLKQLFLADFGVEPFVAVDRAFFADLGMPEVADSEFIWDTFGSSTRSHFELHGVTHDHYMVKWDSLGRDRPGVLATDSDRILKGPERLSQALDESAASDLAVFATWNDLGEGTGINRNYDYYHQGQWLTPHAFMSILRAAQCTE